MSLKAIYLLLFLLFIVFLYYSPIIDQAIALKTFDESSRRFYGEIHEWTWRVYYAIPIVTGLIVLACVLLFVGGKLYWPQHYKRIKIFISVIIISLAIGPGLVVNTLFKENWGRARPYQVLRDGQAYSPVWEPHFHESGNNSFPGGHASIGFFLGVPLLALGYRRRGLAVAIAVGSIVGAIRILQGGHYITDIVFSGVFVWLIAELVYFLVLKMKRFI